MACFDGEDGTRSLQITRVDDIGCDSEIGRDSYAWKSFQRSRWRRLGQALITFQDRRKSHKRSSILGRKAICAFRDRRYTSGLESVSKTWRASFHHSKYLLGLHRMGPRSPRWWVLHAYSWLDSRGRTCLQDSLAREHSWGYRLRRNVSSWGKGVDRWRTYYLLVQRIFRSVIQQLEKPRLKLRSLRLGQYRLSYWIWWRATLIGRSKHKKSTCEPKKALPLGQKGFSEITCNATSFVCIAVVRNAEIVNARSRVYEHRLSP